MLIKSKRGWEKPESAVTPEHVFLDRRRLVQAMGLGAIAVGAAPLLAACDDAGTAAKKVQAATPDDPSKGLYPAKRNDKYKGPRALTEEKHATTYNNFYEYGTSKRIHEEAQALKIRPWTVTIDGLVEKPISMAIDELLKMVQLEERIYSHRCVEAWSMVVPWTGFPVKALIDIAKPKSEAKFLRMETFHDAKMAPGQRQSWYPWPYVEGLTMAEAQNELAFLVTGIYGKPVPPQNGAPLRLVTPWKYGFKAVKSIVKFSFTDKRPVSFWESLQASEYGFWANVNPAVPHPRWSQAQEQVLGTGTVAPTVIWNGYGEYVADMYKDMKGEKLFM